jgi:hypothetical protein
MCLQNLKSASYVKAYKRKQPKEFVVWKCGVRDGKMHFHAPSEPFLSLPGKIYKAGRFYEGGRSALTYRPGFHAFRSRRQAVAYKDHNLVKFLARPEWITAIGQVRRIQCLVLSHIKVLPKKKD